MTTKNRRVGILGAAVLILLLGAGFTGSGMMGGGMMGGMGTMMGGGMMGGGTAGMLVMLLFWAMVIALLVTLVTAIFRQRQRR